MRVIELKRTLIVQIGRSCRSAGAARGCGCVAALNREQRNDLHNADVRWPERRLDEKMDQKTETKLRALARVLLDEQSDRVEMWRLYCQEAGLRYVPEEDGPREAYDEGMVDIMLEEAGETERLTPAQKAERKAEIEEYENNPPLLVEQVAENMAIYAGATDDALFLPHAYRLLGLFQFIEGRPTENYLEIEEWSRTHPDWSSRFWLRQ